MADPKIPWFGYPAFYQPADRLFWTYHVGGMPIWYWLKSVRNWCYVRTCRCWICGKGFWQDGKADNLRMSRKYMAHHSCATKGGGTRLHPEIAEALFAHLDKQRQTAA